MSKILKKNIVVVDGAKKYPIPISGKSKEEIEEEETKETEKTESEDPSEIKNNADGDASVYPAANESGTIQEPDKYDYNFEDFDFTANPTDAADRQPSCTKRENAERLIEDAQRKSDEIIEQAMKAAETIINHTLDSAKAELNNAISAGYADGFETGRNESIKVIEPALNKINVLTETITKLQDKMLYEFRDNMFNIISEISSKIVHKEVDENNHYLVGLFSDAIKNVKAEEFVTVTVAESELKIATRNIDLFLAEIPHIKDFKILPDKNSGKGTMIVETAKAVVDASIDVQLENVETLLEQMKENLNIPNTTDDIIKTPSLRSMRERADGYQDGDDGGGYADAENGDIIQNYGDMDDIDGDDAYDYFGEQ